MLEKYVEKQLRLLSMEKEYQKKEEMDILLQFSHSQLQKKGLALLNLVVNSSRSGLGGKIIVEFQHFQLPHLLANSFSNGDTVGLLSGNQVETSIKLSGIVYRVNESRISVAFKEELFESEKYKM